MDDWWLGSVLLGLLQVGWRWMMNGSQGQDCDERDDGIWQGIENCLQMANHIDEMHLEISLADVRINKGQRS